MKRKTKKYIIGLYCILIIATVLIPLFPYKIYKEISEGKLTKIKFRYDSMDGFISEDNLEGLEEYINNLDINKRSFKIGENNIIGNTLYDELTTFREGKPSYIFFEFYGNIKFNSEGNVSFELKDWYPLGKYIKLIDTYLWENKIKKIYLFLVSIEILSVLILLALRLLKI